MNTQLTFAVVLVVVVAALGAPNVNVNVTKIQDSPLGSASTPKGNAFVQLADSGLKGQNASVTWFACPAPCDYLGCNEWTHNYCYCSNVHNCQTCICLA